MLRRVGELWVRAYEGLGSFEDIDSRSAVHSSKYPLDAGLKVTCDGDLVGDRLLVVAQPSPCSTRRRQRKCDFLLILTVLRLF